MSLLTTHDLTKSFGGITAVDSVEFELHPGEVRALIGPNGAGKSTFVGLVSGRIASDRGRIFFGDADVTALPAHKRIALGMAYTFQITSVFANLTVKENVALAARRHWPHAPKTVESKVEEGILRLGLIDYLQNLAGDLSYGDQRLLEIAMGIVQEPKLLILDEPTQGLAVSAIRDFVSLIEELRRQTTILLIEHNMDVVMQAADRITVLDAGRILAEGSPAEIRTDKAVQSAYLGTA